MMGRLLARGLLVGLVAGLLVFCVGRLIGEPQVDWAIAYEERTAPPAAADEPAPVSRATQAGLGLLTASVVYAAAVGGLFSLVFAAVYGRLGTLGPRGTAALLALAGLVAIVLVPQLKYPANPPAVGSDDTIGARTQLFFVMLALSVAITAGAGLLWQRLRPRLGAWNAAIAAGAAFVAAVALVYAGLPTIDEVPGDFSAAVLWQFRLASLGMHAVLWLTLGLLFGPLAERVLQAPRAPRALRTG